MTEHPYTAPRRCAACQADISRVAAIVIEWHEDTHATRTHCAADVCSWACAARLAHDLHDANAAGRRTDLLHPEAPPPAPDGAPEHDPEHGA